MIVRQDIAVRRQDEAGARRGGLRLIAPVVRGDGGRDADGRVDVLGVDLRGGQLAAGINVRHGQRLGLTLALEEGRAGAG